MTKVKLTQVRSIIGRPQSQRDTLIALGLRKMNASSVRETSPQILGMIAKVSHLVKVEEVK